MVSFKPMGFVALTAIFDMAEAGAPRACDRFQAVTGSSFTDGACRYLCADVCAEADNITECMAEKFNDYCREVLSAGNKKVCARWRPRESAGNFECQRLCQTYCAQSDGRADTCMENIWGDKCKKI